LSTDSEIIETLRRIEDLLRILCGDKVDQLVRRLRKDPGHNAIFAILAETGEMAAGPLKEAVANRADISVRTAQERIRELVARGILKVRRDGRHNFYSISPLVD